MREAELQDNVVGAALTFGWGDPPPYHTHDSRRSEAGFPDLTLVRPPRLIFVELKTHSGWFDFEQPIWLDALHRCGVEVYVWRPMHWLDGTVEHVLRASAPILLENRLPYGGWDPSLAVGKTNKPRLGGRRTTTARRQR